MTFVKGDPRINRKGRPKSFDQLRTLAQKIAHQALTAKDGSVVSVTEAILQKLAQDDPKLFLEIAYGKVPSELKVSGPKKIIVKINGNTDE